MSHPGVCFLKEKCDSVILMEEPSNALHAPHVKARLHKFKKCQVPFHLEVADRCLMGSNLAPICPPMSL